jgi:hypothetical protein
MIHYAVVLSPITLSLSTGRSPFSNQAAVFIVYTDDHDERYKLSTMLNVSMSVRGSSISDFVVSENL